MQRPPNKRSSRMMMASAPPLQSLTSNVLYPPRKASLVRRSPSPSTSTTPIATTPTTRPTSLSSLLDSDTDCDDDDERDDLDQYLDQQDQYHRDSDSEDDGPFDFPEDGEGQAEPAPDTTLPLFSSLAALLNPPAAASSSTLTPHNATASRDMCFCGQPADSENDSIYCSVACGRKDALQALCCSSSSSKSDTQPKARDNGSHYRRVNLAETQREQQREKEQASRLANWRLETSKKTDPPSDSSSSTAAPPPPPRAPPSSYKMQRGDSNSTTSSAVPSLSSSTHSYSTSASSLPSPSLYTSHKFPEDLYASYLDPVQDVQWDDVDLFEDEERDRVASGLGTPKPTKVFAKSGHRPKLSFEDVQSIMMRN